MDARLFRRAACAALVITATTAMSAPEPGSPPPAVDRLGMHVGAVALSSSGALTFNRDGILFVADSRAATIYAVDPAETGQASFPTDARYMVADLDLKVAGLLGTSRDKVRFVDMARNPKTGSLYFSVRRVADDGGQSALVRVRGNDQVELVNLENIRNSSTRLQAAPSADARTPWGQPQWTLAVTDLTFLDGELWVAGLSNEQFASALRRVPFPFGKSTALTSVEIFHTSHDRWETASPITSFLPITLNGTPSLLAGYGCSPIATFTQADLRKGGHVRGRTVAELGGGSQPVDMIEYRNGDKDWILIANSNRTLMRLDPAEIARAPELTTGVGQAFKSAGVGYLSVASAGVMHMVDMPDQVAVMMRDTDTGAVHIYGYAKKWL